MVTPFKTESIFPSWEGTVESVDRTRPGRPIFTVSVADVVSGANVTVRATVSVERHYANDLNHLAAGDAVVVQLVEDQMRIVRAVANPEDFTDRSFDPDGREIVTAVEPEAKIQVTDRARQPSTTTVSGEGIRVEKGRSHSTVTARETRLYYERPIIRTVMVPDPDNPGEMKAEMVPGLKTYDFRVHPSGIEFFGDRAGMTTLGAGAAQGSEGALVVTDPEAQFGIDNWRPMLVRFSTERHVPIIRAIDGTGSNAVGGKVPDPSGEVIGFMELRGSRYFRFGDKLLFNGSAILDSTNLPADILAAPVALTQYIRPGTGNLRTAAERGQRNRTSARQVFEWMQPSVPTGGDIANASYTGVEFASGFETASEISALFTATNQIQYQIDTSSNRDTVFSGEEHSGALTVLQSYERRPPLPDNAVRDALINVASILATPLGGPLLGSFLGASRIFQFAALVHKLAGVGAGVGFTATQISNAAIKVYQIAHAAEIFAFKTAFDLSAGLVSRGILSQAQVAASFNIVFTALDPTRAATLATLISLNLLAASSLSDIFEAEFDTTTGQWVLKLDYESMKADGYSILNIGVNPPVTVQDLTPDIVQVIGHSGWQAQTRMDGFQDSAFSEPFIDALVILQDTYIWQYVDPN